MYSFVNENIRINHKPRDVRKFEPHNCFRNVCLGVTYIKACSRGCALNVCGRIVGRPYPNVAITSVYVSNWSTDGKIR